MSISIVNPLNIMENITTNIITAINNTNENIYNAINAILRPETPILNKKHFVWEYITPLIEQRYKGDNITQTVHEIKSWTNKKIKLFILASDRILLINKKLSDKEEMIRYICLEYIFSYYPKIYTIEDIYINICDVINFMDNYKWDCTANEYDDYAIPTDEQAEAMLNDYRNLGIDC